MLQAKRRLSEAADGCILGRLPWSRSGRPLGLAQSEQPLHIRSTLRRAACTLNPSYQNYGLESGPIATHSVLVSEDGKARLSFIVQDRKEEQAVDITGSWHSRMPTKQFRAVVNNLGLSMSTTLLLC